MGWALLDAGTAEQAILAVVVGTTWQDMDDVHTAILVWLEHEGNSQAFLVVVKHRLEETVSLAVLAVLPAAGILA